MAARTIRVRVHAGTLEPLDALPLPEGSLTTVVIEVPEESEMRAVPVVRKLAIWNLGAPANLTRKDYYGDER